MIDKDDPKQMAEAYRIAVKLLESLEYSHDAMPILDLKYQAEKLDPPYKLDRSLRGWVIVTDPLDGSTHVWKAYENGIVDRAETRPWDDIEQRKWRVTPLRILQPGEVAVPEDLYHAWYGLFRGSDWNDGTHAKLYRWEIEELMCKQAERMGAEK